MARGVGGPSRELINEGGCYSRKSGKAKLQRDAIKPCHGSFSISDG